MNITISYPWDLPEKLSGPAVVIDVNCASHNIAYLVLKASRLYLTTQESAEFALREIPDALFMGESDDPYLKKKFVSNNDAVSVVKTDVKGKEVILLTFNGTATINEALEKGAGPVIAGSYPNLHTVSDYLKGLNVPEVTIIPAGGREKMYSANHNLLEDLLCAQSMKNHLSGKKADFDDVFSKSKKFIQNNSRDENYNYEERFRLIFTSHDTYPVIPLCEKLPNGLINVKKIVSSI